MQVGVRPSPPLTASTVSSSDTRPNSHAASSSLKDGMVMEDRNGLKMDRIWADTAPPLRHPGGCVGIFARQNLCSVCPPGKKYGRC